MSKEKGMESKKRFMYVNPTIRSDIHVAFSLVLLQHFGSTYSGCYFFYAF